MKLSYEELREALKDKPYDMSLTGDDAALIERCVNVGIDSHLEACYSPERGDSYRWECQHLTAAGRSCLPRLHCTVSRRSFPTLVRRINEIAGSVAGTGLTEEQIEVANDLLAAIFSTLGIEEYGEGFEIEPEIDYALDAAGT